MTISETQSKQEIIYIDPVRAAKMLVLIYLCFCIPVVILASVVLFVRFEELPLLQILTAVILNIMVFFVFSWLVFKAYNWGAKRFGGLQFVVRRASSRG
jgi:hypothetical protein